MSTDKRARQKANRANRVAAAEAVAAKDRLRSRIITYGVLAAVVVVAIVGVSILTSDDDPESVDVDPSASPANDNVTPTTEPAESAVSPEPGGSVDGDTECPAEDGSSTQVMSFASAPPMCIDEAASYTATVDTNFGEFTIDLDAAAAPVTVNNFVVLARYGYYDGAPFHRIIPGFMIQGGDPVGNPPGTGGPGYAVDDELPQAGSYEVGSVAMANSGPNTNGSQFFVVTGDQGIGLPPQYSLFGSVSAGLDVVLEIEGTETAAGDAPIEPVTINSVTIIQS